MKNIATVALMLSLGAAGGFAQPSPVKMTFSGSSGASTINLQQPNTTTGEDNFTGRGTLGQFTFRHISSSTSTPQASINCFGPTHLYFLRVAGGGVLRFADGSMLKVNLMQGADCIDLVAQEAHCTVTFQIAGGTGRFKNASGTLVMTETVVPLLVDATKNPVFFTGTGELTGMISGVVDEGVPQDQLP